MRRPINPDFPPDKQNATLIGKGIQWKMSRLIETWNGMTDFIKLGSRTISYHLSKYLRICQTRKSRTWHARS